MQLSIFFIWVVFLLERFASSLNLTGDLDLIDYETLFENDNHQLKNGLILLAAGKLHYFRLI